MKRWIRGTLAFAVAVSLVGCSADSETADAPVDPPAEAPDPVEQQVDQTPEPAPAPPPPAAEPESGGPVSPLTNPASPEMNHMAPASFRVRMETSKGDIVMEFHREWSPSGVDRVYNLFNNGFYDGTKFFRVLDGFIAQWGIHGDPSIQRRWRGANIPDDPVVEGNTRARVTFAKGGPNTRSTQLFINFQDNSNLDPLGFSALGEVVEGMDVALSLYSGYGEGQGARPDATGPDQAQIQRRGNAYLDEEYPELDYVISAEVIE